MRVFVGMIAAVVLAAVAGVPAASAEALSPWWAVASGSQPTNLITGETGRIVVTAENRGDASTSGAVTIVDALPAGLRATGIAGVAGRTNGDSGLVSCVLATLTCTFGAVETTNAKGEKVPEILQPYEEIEVDISVEVQAGGTESLQDTATVSGGGAATAVSAGHAIEVDGSEKFGVEGFQLIAENVGGSVDTEAGSHPFQLTSVVTLNTQTPEPNGLPRTVALPRDIVSELPAGLIADPTGLAQCGEEQFARKLAIGAHEVDACPANTAVGVATVTFDGSSRVGFDTVTAPIFNIEPPLGEPARFGVDALGQLSVFLETSIRSGGDYGVRLAVNNVTEEALLLSMKLTFWGVPGSPAHDSQRGWECLEGFGTCAPAADTTPPPFLSLPTSCGEPLTSTVVGDSWVRRPPVELEPLASYALPALSGCNRLSFEPEIEVSPQARQTSSPSGFDVDVHIPQTGAAPAGEPSPNPESTVTSTVRGISVALPAGVAIDPAAAGGLAACSEGLVGFTGFGAPPAPPGGSGSPGSPGSTGSSGTRAATFTPALPGSFGSSEPLQPGVNFCPDASKIGEAVIRTPLLPSPITGGVYLAAQNANPFGSLLALYIVAEDYAAGTVVKLAGEVSLNPSTGQVTVTFEGTPQLPLEEIELDFFAGERALLATPALCGTYTTDATFTPWSGGEPVHSLASFAIASGSNGGVGGSPCPSSPLPFAPSLAAGTPDDSAGSFTPLTATIARGDGQQALRGFQLHLPPGLEGMLSNVPLCQEAQANAGACGQASQIGETTVSAGVGANPYTLGGGKVYLTEGYEGAPFGLAIVTPVKAGPLDLENAPENHPACDCLVIRAKIEVNPQTAQLTIATGTGANVGTGGIGAGEIPNIIDGIPLQIKDLNITINRSGFIFNPTSCTHLPLTSTISGNEGANVNVSSSFQVANCRNLKFTPKLTASAEGHAEALKGGTGASLNVRIASKDGPGAGADEEANIKRVDLTLPKLLPARLQPTLQNACTKAQFAKDPAGCPPDSFVGTATAVTPMLDVPLRGPAIFVSRGGAALPDLDLVLQGQGVEILLTGHTEVKGDVTYARFETFPDAPISSFALSLPEGPHSALASGLPTNKHSLCGQSLQMPTTIEGQNGAVVKRTTKVVIEGCPQHKTKKAKHRKRKKKSRGG
jgi:hypothetical protein